MKKTVFVSLLLLFLATVASACLLTYITESIPDQKVGVAMNFQLEVCCGTPPYTFSVDFGSLPPGITLNTSTGVLSGTPTTAGYYVPCIKVTDAAGCHLTQCFPITVNP
ncbi:MAG TPA: Ig domain-containing protein [Thermoanaerobaculia bacterium]|nr:Ig domain-containing protein [Thermoanaerobaculia bacterium]